MVDGLPSSSLDLCGYSPLFGTFMCVSKPHELKADHSQIYGLAFFFVGLAGPITSVTSRMWLQNVGTGLYSFASSSGSIYFALNFGDEGM